MQIDSKQNNKQGSKQINYRATKPIEKGHKEIKPKWLKRLIYKIS